VPALLASASRLDQSADPAAEATPTRPRVLLVEDSEDLAWVYRRYLRDESITLEHAPTGAEAMAALDAGPPAAVLLDLNLPDMGGLQILQRIVDTGMPTSVLVITGQGDVDTAVSAMRAGAYDFMNKPVPQERLLITLRNAIERQRLSHLVESYRRDFARDRFQGLIGASLPMQAVYRIIESAASSTATVFITGESGTGKEVCAQAIHACSPRRDKPFIVLNCSAIPRELMESEIFGHVKGAFTGAVQARLGAARAADGGTLFLDEVCEMDIGLQAKLLRFAQSATISPVGADKTERVDVRLICASNRDPLQAVEAGQFREDLYYRLHVIPVSLPPLRERDDDVLLLAHHFLTAYAQEEGKAFASFEPAVAAAILADRWPGNVRQLQNVLRNIVVLHTGTEVRVSMLPPHLTAHVVTQLSRPENANRQAPTGPPAIRPLWQTERDLIEDAIARCGGNIDKAAAQLHINPSTIYRKRTAWARRTGS
jgi:DNA-binding NtrC family response regulator